MCVYVYIYVICFYFKELTHAVVKPASLEFLGQARSLEIHAGFLCYSFEAEFHFWEASVFASMAFS